MLCLVENPSLFHPVYACVYFTDDISTPASQRSSHSSTGSDIPPPLPTRATYAANRNSTAFEGGRPLRLSENGADMTASPRPESVLGLNGGCHSLRDGIGQQLYN